MNPPAAFSIVSGYIPGCLGRIAELHGTYYHAHWNFGLFFEAKVATELSAFLQRCDENRDGIWTALVNDRIEGAIVIDGQQARTEGAHLRWFIVSDALHGQGAGRQLIETALAFCREKHYARVFLWTFKGLDAARHLYESVGFELIDQRQGVQWGTPVEEQYFERRTNGA